MSKKYVPLNSLEVPRFAEIKTLLLMFQNSMAFYVFLSFKYTSITQLSSVKYKQFFFG